MSDYRKLLVWQDAHALVLDVYKLAFGLPREEMYGLSAQIRRSASSIPASIAEGTGPGTEPELARFCRIATGSLNELEYHLLLCRHLSYLPADAYEPLSLRLSALRRMLTKFIQSLS